jgi:hypothetical protein
MLETPAKDLRPGDEFTHDHGDSWWKAISNESAIASRRIVASCVSCQHHGYSPGDESALTLLPDEVVIVRL